MARPPKPTRWSILLVQLASYLAVILFLTTTYGFFFFSTAKSHIEIEVGKKLQDISSIAAGNAPYDRLSLIKIGDEQTRMVLRLKEKFGEIREATGVKDIFAFQTDLSSLLDLQPDIPIGSVYAFSHFNRDLFKQLEQGKAVHTGSYRSDSGKLFISAYAPVMDSDSKLFAVVGVDAGTSEIEVIDQMRVRFLVISGFGAAFAFIFAWALARRLTKPIREMADTAKSIGQGEYAARVKAPSTRELAVLAESINQMAEQVRNRDARLKEISASVAHEIRNPLNSIKLLITLLDEELGEARNASLQNTLATLHHEIGKLTRFLSEFLTFSRPMALFPDQVAPEELIRHVAELALMEARENQVDILVRVDDDLPFIRVDRDRLEQSLLNLTLNAIQACNRQGQVRLIVGGSPEDKGLDFIVEDSGRGVTEEMAKRIFEPFFTTKETGTGLGLSNALKIVSSHGGKILLENLPGGGARFIAHLPRTVLIPKGKANGDVSDRG